MNVVELGGTLHEKWTSLKTPIAIGLDMSRFDQHISASMLRMEHQMYLHCFRHDKELARLLEFQLKNSGTILCDDGRVKFSVDGSRGSGDMNTSLGNSLIMAFIVHSYCVKHNIRCEVIINGDDTVLFVEASDVAKCDGLPGFCTDLGFVLKVEKPVDVFEQVVFCQMQPVYNGEQWVMVRQYPRCLSKDATITTSIASERVCRSFLAGLGLAGVALTPGIPVMNAHYSRLSELACPMTDAEMAERGVALLQWRGTLKPMVHAKIHPRARYSFYLAFGVLPELQEAMEAQHLPPIVWDPNATSSVGHTHDYEV
jgi:hypothetical protein